MKQHTIVITWMDPDFVPWVYGPFDHEPTETEIAAARAEFMTETGTSENDWEEFGCVLKTTPLLTPPQPKE